METAIQLFQSVGFPVACVICLGWYLKTYIDKVEKANTTREENYQNLIKTIQEEKKTLLDLLNNYKDNMEKIAEKLEVVSNDVGKIKEKINC